MASEVVVRRLCDLCLRSRNERVDASFSQTVSVGHMRRSLDLCEPCSHELRTLEQWLDVVASFGTKPVEAGPEEASSWPCLLPDCERAHRPYKSASGLRNHMITRHGTSGSVKRSQEVHENPLVCRLPNCDHPEPFLTTAGFRSHQRRHTAQLETVSA